MRINGVMNDLGSGQLPFGNCYLRRCFAFHCDDELSYSVVSESEELINNWG